MPTRKPRARAERRAADRDAQKTADARARLAAIEPGGAPTRPLEVASASIVEPSALSLGCARCGGALVLDDHAAREIDGVRLRVVRGVCKACGAARVVYVRIVVALPS